MLSEAPASPMDLVQLIHLICEIECHAFMRLPSGEIYRKNKSIEIQKYTLSREPVHLFLSMFYFDR